MNNATVFLAHQRIREAQREASEARLARASRHQRRDLLARIRGTA